jgi:DNA-binding SARP family transcriptional activator/TolB-like protein
MANHGSGQTGDVRESEGKSAPRLLVSLIGGAVFTFDGREIALRNRKARAMLAYLALSDRGEEQRERIAGLFWSESPEAQARGTLRQAVHEAREAMMVVGCDALVGTRTTVSLRPGSFAVDVETVLHSLASSEVPETILQRRQTAEALLAGFEDLDPAFHGWLTARRQTFHDRMMRELEQGYHNAALPRRQRRRLAEASLLLDPTHEEASRVVMRCAAEDGEIGAALHAYDELYRLLGDEYDMEPSAPTQALVAEIKQGKFDIVAAPQGGLREAPAPELPDEVTQILIVPRTVQAPGPAPAPPTAKPVLVIAPFDIHGVEPGRVYLVEGFRLELIACLVRFREWYVTDSEDRATTSLVGAPISTRYRVNTTTYQAGSAISAVMVVQDQSTGVVVWSERFEVRLDNWIATQQRLVRRLASTLSIELSTERLGRLAGTPDASLEAYDVWLRAQLLILRFTPENWNDAAQMLANAIERAPNFSPLYSSLVQMNNTFHIAHPGVFRARHKEERTLGLAQQAVRLDPRDSRAELSLGWALAMNKRYGQAETHMEIACELNPYDAWTLIAAGMFHAFIGNRDRAQALSAQAMELTLSPSLAQWTYLATTRYLCGDDEGLLAASAHAHALTPQPYPWRTQALSNLFAWRAAALCNLGRRKEAREEAKRFLELTRANWFGDSPVTDAMIGRWLLHIYPMGDAAVWRRLHAGLAAAGIPDGGMAHHGW